MAYTLNQTITEVRALLNEDTASYWSDTNITSWIQQGCLDFTEKSLLLVRKDTVALSTGVNQYSTSASSYIDDALRTIHAEYNNKAMQRITYENIRGHNARTLGGITTPTYYFDLYNGTAFNIYIGPTPTATEDSTNVTVYFACKTDDITDIPYEYQPFIFLFAAYKAKMRERLYQEAHLYFQQYINNITFARQDGLVRGIQDLGAFRIQ